MNNQGSSEHPRPLFAAPHSINMQASLDQLFGLQQPVNRNRKQCSVYQAASRSLPDAGRFA